MQPRTPCPLLGTLALGGSSVFILILGTRRPPDTISHAAIHTAIDDAVVTGRAFVDGFLRDRNIWVKLDLCAHNSTLCGLEAGCHNVNGTFVCLCTSDLKPKRPHEPCSKAPVAQGNGYPPERPPAAPRCRLLHASPNSRHEPELHSHRKGGLESQEPQPAGGAGSAGALLPDTTSRSGGTAPLLTGLLAVLGTLALAGLVVAVLVRRHRRRREARRAAAGSLHKCMQQYVTNPTLLFVGSGDAAAKSAARRRDIRRLHPLHRGDRRRVLRQAVYTHPDGSEEDVAVKVLKESVSNEAQSDFEREVQIMSSFKHENILKLLGVVFKESGSIPWMVFEFMTYGDLAELLRANGYGRDSATRKPPTQLTLSDLPWLATQIASGMCYLSSQHFVHRDLATRNCLVGNDLCVKISDFGMSRDIYTCDYYKIRGSRMLPVRWMAPESIMYGKFTLESDVWSYGVVLWEIFTFGKQPYYGHSNEEVVKLILQGILLSPPEECPPHVCTLMAGCWKTEPRDRLSFSDIYKRLVDTYPPPPPPQDEPEPLEEELDSEDYLVPKAPAAPRHQPW
ncbi:hypothetical protein MTO96_013490 [Rhipicephalus appendiculatus]